MEFKSWPIGRKWTQTKKKTQASFKNYYANLTMHFNTTFIRTNDTFHSIRKTEIQISNKSIELVFFSSFKFHYYSHTHIQCTTHIHEINLLTFYYTNRVELLLSTSPTRKKKNKIRYTLLSAVCFSDLLSLFSVDCLTLLNPFKPTKILSK